MPLVLLFVMAGGWWWWPSSPDFYHQPASYRYRAIDNDDEELLAQWRARGPEGIQELASHVPVRNRYFGEKYHSFVLWLRGRNLLTLANWLPTPRIWGRFSQSRNCILLLADLGPEACTPHTVAALAKTVNDPNASLASDAVNCLRKWGPSASNALPALLTAQRKETQNGGRGVSANQPLGPNYAAALASIGVNSKETLIELLRAEPRTSTSQYAVRWCRNSSQAPAMLAEIVTNQAVEIEIRVGAIGVGNACEIESLLPGVAPTLVEPKLVIRWVNYLQNMGDKTGPYLRTILNQLGALADTEYSTNIGPNYLEQMVFKVGDLGRSRVEELYPVVLRYALDEKWPFAAGYAWPNKPFNLHQAFCAQLQLLPPSFEASQNLLLSGLEHSDWRVRAGAAEQLLFGKLGSRETAALVKCLRDENATVRAIAAQLLLRVEAHRPEALKETWAVFTNRTLPFRRRICAIGSVRGEWLSAGDKLQAVKILDTLAEEPEAELRNRALAKRKEIAP